MDTVVVTGSRIRGAADERTAPVTEISQQELARGGNDSLGRALQRLPFSTGSAPNTNVNNGGDGSTRVDLRGLTPKRTLVLLNGRRLPNGGVGADSSVDIDSLPLSMVERVEVLTTGASAVYGADAIGGVVNVITREDVEGVEVGAQFSQAERGDGEISRAQLLLGTQTGRGTGLSGSTWWINKRSTWTPRLFRRAVPRGGRNRRARGIRLARNSGRAILRCSRQRPRSFTRHVHACCLAPPVRPPMTGGR
jgi:iron complex outermembrane receptor protein